MDTALADLDFDNQPTTAGDVISLKNQAIVRTVQELLPQQEINAFLGSLQTQYRGQTYSPEDFVTMARDAGIDFNVLVGNWLNSTDLPGFLAQKPIVETVADSNEDEFDYQTSFVLRNNESVPGAVAVEYYLVGERMVTGEEHRADTVHVPGNTTLRVALTHRRAG